MKGEIEEWCGVNLEKSHYFLLIFSKYLLKDTLLVLCEISDNARR